MGFAVRRLFSVRVFDFCITTAFGRQRGKKVNNTQENECVDHVLGPKLSMFHLFWPPKSDDSEPVLKSNLTFGFPLLNDPSAEANGHNAPLVAQFFCSAKTHIGGMAENEVCICHDEKQFSLLLYISFLFFSS